MKILELEELTRKAMLAAKGPAASAYSIAEFNNVYEIIREAAIVGRAEGIKETEESVIKSLLAARERI